MPGMDGRELFQNAIKIQPDIHVLYMSGLPDDEMSLRNKIGTEIDFIPKPFTLRGLTTKVREVLDRE
jgi:FixJ family two-component response regulator